MRSHNSLFHITARSVLRRAVPALCHTVGCQIEADLVRIPTVSSANLCQSCLSTESPASRRETDSPRHVSQPSEIESSIIHWQGINYSTSAGSLHNVSPNPDLLPVAHLRSLLPHSLDIAPPQ